MDPLFSALSGLVSGGNPFMLLAVILFYVIYKQDKDRRELNKAINDEKDKRLADALAYNKASDDEKEATRNVISSFTSKLDGFLNKK